MNATEKPESLSTIRRRVAAKISRMTKAEANAYIYAHALYAGHIVNGKPRAGGGRLGDPAIRALTGGYSSQSIDGLVLFSLGRVS